MFLQDAVPAFRIELLAIDDRSDTMHQRGDDAVGRAGHPAGVGGAPVDVVGVQIERVAAGGPVRDDRTVYVHGALRRPRRATGEMHQRHVFFGSGLDLQFGRSRVEQGRQVECSGNRRASAVLRHQQDVLQRRHAVTPLGDLAFVERVRRHQHLARAEIYARGDGLRAKGREQRRDHRTVLQAAQYRDVEFRDAAGEDEQPVALADAEVSQYVGEAVGQPRQLAVTHDAFWRSPADEAKCLPLRLAGGDVPVDGFMGNVDPLSLLGSRRGGKGVACCSPGELSSLR